MPMEYEDFNSESAGEHLVSVGRLLRDQRESDGIKIETVAQELFIDKMNLEALENDDFDKMGSKVFIRGYARNYARYLGLDAEQIIAMLEPRLDRISSRASRNINFLDADKRTRSELDYSKAHFNLKDRKRVILWPYATIALILIAMALFIGYRFISLENDERVQDQELALETIERLDVEEPVTTIPVPIVDRSSEIDSPGELIEQQFIEQEFDDTLFFKDTSVDTESELLPGQRRLEFSFNGNSWLNIVDASGKEVTSQTYSKSDIAEFIVEVPIKIVLGNANKSSLKVDDKTFDFSVFTRGDVARFSIE